LPVFAKKEVDKFLERIGQLTARLLEFMDSFVGSTLMSYHAQGSPLGLTMANKIKRKLAAILAADVVGYSKMMGVDEVGTLNALSTHRTALFEPKIAEHDGRVVKLMGDGLLAEFPSAVEAVECAVEIQNQMASRNDSVARDHQITFRIGINIGDIIVEGEDIYGDGINIAARIEALAEPGGICLSGNVHNQVKGKLGFAFEDMGAQEMKNIAEPISVYRVALGEKALVLPSAKPRYAKTSLSLGRLVVAAAAVLGFVVGGLAWWQPWVPRMETASVERMALPLPEKPSIAVLPFDNLSGDPDQAHFSDGMTDDLITDLSKVSGLFVIARNTSFTFRGKSVAIPEVAEKLGVRYVLEGSVRRSGNQVRVNAQLIDATTGGHLWADRYDGDVTDFFLVQDTFVNKIVGALSLKLSKSEQEEIVKGQTANAEARAAYQRGWELYQRFTAKSNARAVSQFKLAAEIDPNYGRAYSALSMAFVRGCQWRWHEELKTTPRGAFDQATLFLKKAEPNSSSMTKVAASQLKLYDNKHDVAFTEAASAVAMDPNDPEAQVAMGLAMITTGRPKAGLEFVKTAVRLNPTYPTHYALALALGYFSLNEMEQVVATLEATLKRNPSAFDLVPLLAASYAHLGRRKEARSALLLWKPGASDDELRSIEHAYHFPYGFAYSESKVELRLKNGLFVAGLPLDVTVASLTDILQRGETSERVRAMENLVRFGATSVFAVPNLILAIQDEDKFVVQKAIWTLGMIGPSAKAAIPALEAMRDKQEVKLLVNRALKRIEDR
jgi:TolB-like protein/class 3 adenylate cyclase